MNTAKHLYDTYLASREQLLKFAAQEFKKLAEDHELVEALAWLWESSADHVRNAK